MVMVAIVVGAVPAGATPATGAAGRAFGVRTATGVRESIGREPVGVDTSEHAARASKHTAAMNTLPAGMPRQLGSFFIAIID